MNVRPPQQELEVLVPCACEKGVKEADSEKKGQVRLGIADKSLVIGASQSAYVAREPMFAY